MTATPSTIEAETVNIETAGTAATAMNVFGEPVEKCGSGDAAGRTRW